MYCSDLMIVYADACSLCFFFFFSDPATTAIYTYCHTLSLHDALPIYEVGSALRSEVASLRAKGRKLRFGVVHRYSSHNYMLRYWLSACGIRPDHDVEIVTVAPPFSADALAAGEIDGSCVGAPWHSSAVDRGVGCIVLAIVQIWRSGGRRVGTERGRTG